MREKQPGGGCRRIEGMRSAGPRMDRSRGNGYLDLEADMLKRIADWLEKVSVAAIAVGLFQDQFFWGVTVSVITLIGSLKLTKKVEG